MANSYKYPLLNDREWLRQKYEIDKLSTREIAILAGAKTANSARQALIRNNIAVRSISDGLTCNRNTCFVVNEHVLHGSLLGDAGLARYNVHSKHSYPEFYKKNRYYDHVLFVAKALCGNDAEGSISEEYGGKDKNGATLSYPVFFFSTHVRKELVPFFEAWYPESSGYKKVIPANLQLTHEMLLHWFLDDGSTSYRNRNREMLRNGWKMRTQQILITFCSESFHKDQQDMLCAQMSSKFGLRARTIPCNSGTGWRIRIPQSQASLFYEVIGQPPVPSLAYKWKYLDS